jgi:hypothetical protein
LILSRFPLHIRLTGPAAPTVFDQKRFSAKNEARHPEILINAPHSGAFFKTQKWTILPQAKTIHCFAFKKIPLCFSWNQNLYRVCANPAKAAGNRLTKCI